VDWTDLAQDRSKWQTFLFHTFVRIPFVIWATVSFLLGTMIHRVTFPTHAMKPYRGTGGIDPLILSQGTRWRWVISLLALVKDPPVHNQQVAGWIPEPVWAFWRGEIPCTSRDASPRSSSLSPSHCTDCATPARFICMTHIKCHLEQVT
jgi:hypothetical protein